MKNPIGWFEIYVDDIARAKAFYQSVFLVTLEQLPTTEIQMWAFPGDMNQYGSTGALVKMDGFSSGKNSVIVYFNCDDCSVEEKRIVNSGGQIEKSKFSIGPYGFITLAIDTEGNMIGLHSQQ